MEVLLFEDIQKGTSRCVDEGAVEVLLIENNKLISRLER